MYKNYAFRTNFIICAIIIIGFSITSVIGYRSNVDTLKKEAENVTRLASEGMMYQMDAIFAQSIHISLTMAHDSFLINFLSREKENLHNPGYTQTIKEYLAAYKKKYGYDSVFLVSTLTNRYYNFMGINRIVDRAAPENSWVDAFLAADQEFSLNIDNDKAAHDTITVFVNCSVKNSEGDIVGIVGVGFTVSTVKAMLAQYEQRFSVKSYLVDTDGDIRIASSSGGAAADTLTRQALAAVSGKLRREKTDGSGIWHSGMGADGYAIARYLPTPNLYLVTDKDTSQIIRQIRKKYYTGAIVVLFTMIIVILVVTRIILSYKRKIIALTVTEELKYHAILQNATSQIYDSIVEFDITSGMACGAATQNFLQRLGLKSDTSYSAMLQAIASKCIHPDHARQYFETFCPEAVNRAHHNHCNKLSLDFLLAQDDGVYTWFRETGYILQWGESESIHIVLCRQNIDADKRQELCLQEMAQKDGLTGLFNKMTTEDRIEKRLGEYQDGDGILALVMLDIDNFKLLNDSQGHMVGDRIIQEFARSLRASFDENDLVGRVGGDEFIVLTRQRDQETLRLRLEELFRNVRATPHGIDGKLHIAVSMGVALCPRHGNTFAKLYAGADAALYRAKQNGKDTFVFFE